MLISQKVDCAKLQNVASLASYVKKTIPTMLLDQVFQEVYGLSYGQIKTVKKMRRAKDTIRQQSGHDPSDDEVAQLLGISMRRLYDIRQWEKQLDSVSFDQDRDGGSPSDDEYQSY